MAAGKPYGSEVKAAALARVAAGESISAVARDMGIGRATLQAWRDVANIPAPTPAGQEKRIDLNEQLWGLLADSFRALRSQLAVFADPRYVSRQNAHDMAILHGVIADKTGRLLAAAVGSGDAGGGPGPADAGDGDAIEVG